MNSLLVTFLTSVSCVNITRKGVGRPTKSNKTGLTACVVVVIILLSSDQKIIVPFAVYVVALRDDQNTILLYQIFVPKKLVV